MANKEIVVKKVNMNFKGFSIHTENNFLTIQSLDGSKMIIDNPTIYGSGIKLFSDGRIAIGAGTLTFETGGSLRF